jgi:hypothetical protein
MAESPARYCGNCEHELSSEDRFCRNCGRPAHQTASVGTPEADVSGPPCSQPGRTNPRSATPETRDREPPPAILRGRRLSVARLAWMALATLAVGLFVASVPVAYWEFRSLCEGAECHFLHRLSPADAKVLKGWGLSPGFFAAYTILQGIVLALGYWAIGAVLFWKRSDHRLGLYASTMFVTYGATGSLFVLELADAYPSWDLLVEITLFVADASWFVVFCIFPDGHFVPRWTRWAAVVWVARSLCQSVLYDTPFGAKNWPLFADFLLTGGLVGSLVLAQVYRYRRVSGPVARQQTKWVVYGLAILFAVFVGWFLIDEIRPRSATSKMLFLLVGDPILYCARLLIPLSMGIAIQRYHLWHIDFIINRTLVYSSLSALLTIVFAITDQLLQYLLFFIIRVEQSGVATFASLAVIAVAFQPMRRRIEMIVDRLVQRRIGGAGTS